MEQSVHRWTGYGLPGKNIGAKFVVAYTVFVQRVPGWLRSSLAMASYSVKYLSAGAEFIILRAFLIGQAAFFAVNFFKQGTHLRFYFCLYWRNSSNFLMEWFRKN